MQWLIVGYFSIFRCGFPFIRTLVCIPCSANTVYIWKDVEKCLY